MAGKKSYSAGNVDGSGNSGQFSGILKARDRGKQGETKARNGFSTLKIGGCHVISPWGPLLLASGAGPGEGARACHCDLPLT